MAEIKKGDFVKIAGQEAVAEVLAVKGNDLEVTMGLMKMTVKKNKVSIAKAPYQEEQKSGPGEDRTQTSGIDTKERLMHFKFELDVRGKMKDEVIQELPAWVDDALLLGIKEAKIVHGRGTGVLKETVRSFLRKYKEIESAGDESGNDFVTVVKFKV